MRLVAISIAVSMLYFACKTNPDPKPPPSLSDGGIPGSPEAACTRLNDLHCPEALDAHGVSCVDRMTKYKATPYLGIDPLCISQATDKSMLPKCGVTCL